MANLKHVKKLKLDIISWNKWRKANPTIAPDLESADFGGAHLGNANLSNSNLTLANLNGAGLIFTNFRDAKLNFATLNSARCEFADFMHVDCDSANFKDADLKDTHFNFANLKDADFRGARLNYGNFYQTRLKGTNWDHITLGQTVFIDVDLSEVKNLASVIHAAPSFVSFETLFNPRNANVPENFWRGCGVDEETIKHMKDKSWQPIQFYSVFISYTHADKAFARRLHDQLQGRGIRCWLDEHQINPGDNIFDEVDRGLKLWDKVLLVCSANSLKEPRWWLDNEINKAFVKEQMLQKQKGEKVLALIPLDLDGYLFQWQDGKADQVRSRLAADFKGWEKNNSIFEAQFERVVKALRTDGGKEKPPQPLL